MGHIEGNIEMVSRDVFIKMCSVADTASAEMVFSNLKEPFGEKEAEKLVENRAFIYSGSKQDIDVIVDDEERSYAVEHRNGTLSYFQPNSARWYPADVDKLKVYKVSFDWLLNAVMSAFGIDSMKPVAILEEKIWFIGSAWLKKRKTPIIFVRNITRQEVLEKLDDYLREKHKSQPALTLTTANNIPAYFKPHSQSRLVKVNEAVDPENDKLVFNVQYLSDKMGGYIEKEGFSDSYRTLHHSNGQLYKFTPMKASALQFMFDAGKPMHQHDILAAANSDQKRLIDLFKNDKAWKVIFKPTGDGYYELDL